MFTGKINSTGYNGTAVSPTAAHHIYVQMNIEVPEKHYTLSYAVQTPSGAPSIEPLKYAAKPVRTSVSDGASAIRSLRRITRSPTTPVGNKRYGSGGGSEHERSARDS